LAGSLNQDGNRCKLITVVTGIAASAAADLLALGDYAISYLHTRIFYHGSRQDADSAITVESATTMVSSLRQTNEFFARRLEKFAFKRLFLRLT
jgi:ATP-dependent protease ClpP protease subunit